MTLDRLGKKLLETLQGETETEFSLILKPDRRDDNEAYLLVGDQPELKSQISLIMALRQMFEYYGLGDALIGEPYQQFVWKNPAPLLIQIHWRLTDGPPWEPYDLIEKNSINRASPPRPQVTIPVDKELLLNDGWNRIKNAAGGPNGFIWGEHYAVARIGTIAGKEVGKGGQIKVYGNTEQTCLTRLNALLALTGSNLFTVTSGKEKQDAGARATDAGFRKPNVQVFPAWFTVINWELVDEARRNPQSHRSTALGKMMKRKGKIYLHHATQPASYLEDIRKLIGLQPIL